MPRSFWDWLAYGLVAFAALVEATEEASSRLSGVVAHFPSLLTWGGWNFAPIIFVVIAAILWITRALKPVRQITPIGQSTDGLETPLTRIENKTFRNEKVTIDGREFYKCKFENITLEYNGERFSLRNNIFTGVLFTTNDPRIERSWRLLQALGFLVLPAYNPDNEVMHPGHGLQPPPSAP